MSDSFSQFLLQSHTSRWTASPLRLRRPAPELPMCWRLVAGHAFYTSGLAAVIGGTLARIAAGAWSGTAFVWFGGYGFLTGFLWATLVRTAWNRRARHLRAPANAGRPAPESIPFTGARRLLGPLYTLLILGTALALMVGIENLRGSLALRAFHREIHARGGPVTLEEIIPPPVPDELNLAEAPFLKPLFAPGPTGTESRASGGGASAGKPDISREDPSLSFRSFASGRHRKEIGFAEGASTDLAMWQSYYQSLTDWPQAPDSPQLTPAQAVLHALSRHEGKIKTLREAASARPQARFPLEYEKNFSMLLPHLAFLKGAALTLGLRATALLAEGRSQEALEDIALIQRLSDSVRAEPILISQLVRITINAPALQAIWEGCRDRRWSADQLGTLQKSLELQNPIQDLRLALSGERVLVSGLFDQVANRRISAWMFGDVGPDSAQLLIKFSPRGWVRLNQVSHGQYISTVIDASAAAASHSELPPAEVLLPRFITPKSPFNLLSALVLPALDAAFNRSYDHEAWRRLAVTGLALEHYRLAHGNYPDHLSALSPAFLKAVPDDIMDGKPLRYARTTTGDFTLYSVGLDHHDNGGRRPTKRGSNASERESSTDLAWRGQPAAPQ